MPPYRICVLELGAGVVRARPVASQKPLSALLCARLEVDLAGPGLGPRVWWNGAARASTRSGLVA